VLSEVESVWEAVWNNQGRCSGLNITAYFTFLAASFNLFSANVRPAAFMSCRWVCCAAFDCCMTADRSDVGGVERSRPCCGTGRRLRCADVAVPRSPPLAAAADRAGGQHGGAAACCGPRRAHRSAERGLGGSALGVLRFSVSGAAARCPLLLACRVPPPELRGRAAVCGRLAKAGSDEH
jgi:hypothetical protein